jgi:acyl homoserine lactone synthase
MLECVTLSTNHLFEGNPIYEMHRLRYQSIIKRQNWDVPVIKDMEYDAYDNPAAYYLIKRDEFGQAIGCSRLYPTDRPYMLKDAFAYLVSKIDMPQSSDVWEGSRFCVAQHLLPEQRKVIIQEMVVGYLEFAQRYNIKSIIGVMYPIYWNNIFIKVGWNVEWLGDIHKSSEGHKIIAGDLKVSNETLKIIREKTGIHYSVLDDGSLKKKQYKAA